jgi:hypothetical protein
MMAALPSIKGFLQINPVTLYDLNEVHRKTKLHFMPNNKFLNQPLLDFMIK